MLQRTIGAVLTLTALSGGLPGTSDAGQQTQTPARRADAIGTIAERTAGMKKIDGFFPLYWDESGGQLWMEVPTLDTEVLHFTGFGDRPRFERHRHRSWRA